MLINWGIVGPERRFEIRVRDVQTASSFYRDVFGACETFRHTNDNGEVVRLGLAVGRVGFIVSSEDEEGVEPALLDLLAAEFEVPYIAIMLQVDDPDRLAITAMKKGAALMEAPNGSGVAVVRDPFGSHWAFVKWQPAEPSLISPGLPAPKALH